MYRDRLPQLDGELFLTDSGLSTALVLTEGVQLPSFAAFVLVESAEGTDLLRRYFERHMAIAAESGLGFVAESPTWRANKGWGATLGYDAAGLERVNRRCIELLESLRTDYESDPGSPFVISGCVGPRGDSYDPRPILTPDEAEDYHREQVATLADTSADLVTASTMTHPGEAIGIVRAAQAASVPSAVSFTVETDGRLPSGEPLSDAVAEVDEATGGGPAYFMINCAHPTHFEQTLDTAEPWVRRVRGIRSNPSRLSHADLEGTAEFDPGDPDELGADYARLRASNPQLTVLGGCCGTDERHIAAIRDACVGQ